MEFHRPLRPRRLLESLLQHRAPKAGLLGTRESTNPNGLCREPAKFHLSRDYRKGQRQPHNHLSEPQRYS